MKKKYYAFAFILPLPTRFFLSFQPLSHLFSSSISFRFFSLVRLSAVYIEIVFTHNML